VFQTFKVFYYQYRYVCVIMDFPIYHAQYYIHCGSQNLAHVTKVTPLILT